MTAQEIKQMNDEEIIGFHRGLPPFRAKRMDWRHFSILRQRQRIPPPQLYPLPQLENTSFSNGQAQKEVGAILDSPRLVDF